MNSSPKLLHNYDNLDVLLFKSYKSIWKFLSDPFNYFLNYISILFCKTSDQ